MKYSLLAVSFVALLLFGPLAARAEVKPDAEEAVQQLADALTNLGITITLGAIRELSIATERLVKDHVEVESWSGPAIEPDEYVGGLNLKLYPRGKSQSNEHFKTETFYRFDQYGLKELEFSTSRK
jgi:hypothetical protein